MRCFRGGGEHEAEYQVALPVALSRWTMDDGMHCDVVVCRGEEWPAQRGHHNKTPWASLSSFIPANSRDRYFSSSHNPHPPGSSLFMNRWVPSSFLPCTQYLHPRAPNRSLNEQDQTRYDHVSRTHYYTPFHTPPCTAQEPVPTQ